MRGGSVSLGHPESCPMRARAREGQFPASAAAGIERDPALPGSQSI